MNLFSPPIAPQNLFLLSALFQKEIRKLAFVKHGLQNIQNLVILRCCFAVEDKNKRAKIYNSRAQPISCLVNLSFGDVRFLLRCRRDLYKIPKEH